MEMTETGDHPGDDRRGRGGETYLAGSVARQVLPCGVPIARSAIVQPGDRGFLAAALPKGMRAITIPVTETAGLNGLALPGDRVDLILTYFVTAKDDNGNDDDAKPRDIHASETVAQTSGCWRSTTGSARRVLNEDGETDHAAPADKRDPASDAAAGGGNHPRDHPRQPVAGAELGARWRLRCRSPAGAARAGRPRSARAQPQRRRERHRHDARRT